MGELARINLGWKFLPGTSQEFALSCPADHILLHGTRGPGKTDTQLMRYRSRVGLGYGPFWRGVIFDREYKNLDDLIVKSRRWFNDFGDGAEFLSSNSALKWRWPTGEELLFRVGEGLNDYWSYHGHEYPFIGFNELTKYVNGDFYDAIQSTNRTGFDPERDTPRDSKGNYKTPDGRPLPPIPLECFSTTNPYGAGHAWVKRKFIDVSEPGVITKITTKVLDPKTKQDVEVTRTQTHIYSHWSENPNLDPKYIASLSGQTDENRRKAWFVGSWNINAGGVFADLWHKPSHVVDRFPIPAEWHVNRAFDWGSSHPFSVGWWAEANGEDIEFQGKTYRFAKGSLIRFFEWYGATNLESNEGLKMSAKDIATGILEREQALRTYGWCHAQIYPGPADNQIRNVNEKETETIEKKMQDKGVHWEASDKSKGSRVQGVQLMRDRLQASVLKEGPGIYIMDNCRAFIALVPDLPRDDKNLDDVLTTSIDHIWDETRYRVLASDNRVAKVIKVDFAGSQARG